MTFDLKKQGYEVSTAGRGKEELNHLEQNDASLIFTDYNMDGMNGIELMRKIKLPTKVPKGRFFECNFS